MLPLPTSKDSHKSIPAGRIRTLEEAGKHASAAKILQAILDYRSSRNLSQPSISAKVVSMAQIPPRGENDFSEQSTDQGPITDIVDKEPTRGERETAYLYPREPTQSRLLAGPSNEVGRYSLLPRKRAA